MLFGGCIFIVCGFGNNGGDGFVVVWCLVVVGFLVDIWLLKDFGVLNGDVRLVFE